MIINKVRLRMVLFLSQEILLIDLINGLLWKITEENEISNNNNKLYWKLYVHV